MTSWTHDHAAQQIASRAVGCGLSGVSPLGGEERAVGTADGHLCTRRRQATSRVDRIERVEAHLGHGCRSRETALHQHVEQCIAGIEDRMHDHLRRGRRDHLRVERTRSPNEHDTHRQHAPRKPGSHQNDTVIPTLGRKGNWDCDSRVGGFLL